jgi:hypothetical protein
MGNDATLRAQYGCAAGPVVTSTIIRTSGEGLAIAKTSIKHTDIQMPSRHQRSII